MADFQIFTCLNGSTHTRPLNVMEYSYKSDDKINYNALCLQFYLMVLANTTRY